MKAAIFRGEKNIELGERPDPTIKNPTDAIVRVVRGCVCGSDLWYYRGINSDKVGSIGHEYIGVVEAVGDDVRNLAVGTSSSPRSGSTTAPAPPAWPGSSPTASTAARSATVRSTAARARRSVPRSPTPPSSRSPAPTTATDEQLASLTALSDVMCTGYHDTVSAGVKQGDTVAVVGDGAVGLSGVLTANLLGAGRIIALSRHADRQALAKEFGATDIVEERREEAIEAVLRLTDGTGVDAALECVGCRLAVGAPPAAAHGRAEQGLGDDAGGGATRPFLPPTGPGHRLPARVPVLQAWHCAPGDGRRCSLGQARSPGQHDQPRHHHHHAGEDELTGPRGEGYRRMIEISAAGRAGTPDEVGMVGALLMGQGGGFITGATS